MRIRDMNVYFLSTAVLAPNVLFSKNPQHHADNERLNNEMYNSVFNPPLTTEGLEQRKIGVNVLVGSLTMIATYLAIVPLYYLLIFGNSVITSMLFMVPFYLLSTAIYIAFRRSNYAYRDARRFRKEGCPADFQPDERAYVQWKDLLPPIPMSLIPFMLPAEPAFGDSTSTQAIGLFIVISFLTLVLLSIGYVGDYKGGVSSFLEGEQMSRVQSFHKHLIMPMLALGVIVFLVSGIVLQ
jgi:hypothetical protein